MSIEHNRAARVLAHQFNGQLSLEAYEVLQNAGHLGVPDGDSYIPDVAIVPAELVRALRQVKGAFERYVAPVLLAFEIWSPSTGLYDIDRKLPGDQARGDLEIWRIHPYDRTVTMWRRQEDGGYE
jgi:Uma2 family endonuclease